MKKIRATANLVFKPLSKGQILRIITKLERIIAIYNPKCVLELNPPYLGLDNDIVTIQTYLFDKTHFTNDEFINAIEKARTDQQFTPLSLEQTQHLLALIDKTNKAIETTNIPEAPDITRALLAIKTEIIKTNLTANDGWYEKSAEAKAEECKGCKRLSEIAQLEGKEVHICDRCGHLIIEGERCGCHTDDGNKDANKDESIIPVQICQIPIVQSKDGKIVLSSAEAQKIVASNDQAKGPVFILACNTPEGNLRTRYVHAKEITEADLMQAKECWEGQWSVISPKGYILGTPHPDLPSLMTDASEEETLPTRIEPRPQDPPFALECYGPDNKLHQRHVRAKKLTEADLKEDAEGCWQGHWTVVKPEKYILGQLHPDISKTSIVPPLPPKLAPPPFSAPPAHPILAPPPPSMRPTPPPPPPGSPFTGLASIKKFLEVANITEIELTNFVQIYRNIFKTSIQNVNDKNLVLKIKKYYKDDYSLLADHLNMLKIYNGGITFSQLDRTYNSASSFEVSTPKPPKSPISKEYTIIKNFLATNGLTDKDLMQFVEIYKNIWSRGIKTPEEKILVLKFKTIYKDNYDLLDKHLSELGFSAKGNIMASGLTKTYTSALASFPSIKPPETKPLVKPPETKPSPPPAKPSEIIELLRLTPKEQKAFKKEKEIRNALQKKLGQKKGNLATLKSNLEDFTNKLERNESDQKNVQTIIISLTMQRDILIQEIKKLGMNQRPDPDIKDLADKMDKMDVQIGENRVKLKKLKEDMKRQQAKTKELPREIAKLEKEIAKLDTEFTDLNTKVENMEKRTQAVAKQEEEARKNLEEARKKRQIQVQKQQEEKAKQLREEIAKLNAGKDQGKKPSIPKSKITHSKYGNYQLCVNCGAWIGKGVKKCPECGQVQLVQKSLSTDQNSPKSKITRKASKKSTKKRKNN